MIQIINPDNYQWIGNGTASDGGASSGVGGANRMKRNDHVVPRGIIVIYGRGSTYGNGCAYGHGVIYGHGRASGKNYSGHGNIGDRSKIVEISVNKRDSNVVRQWR